MLKSLKYLGVDIFPSLYSTIVKDFWGILRRVEADEKMVTFILPILFLICYLMPYVLCPLSVWLDPIALVSWRTIQENLALPHRLQDLVYSNVLYLQTIQAGLCIVSLLLSTWHLVKKKLLPLSGTCTVPFFIILLTGGVSFCFPPVE